LPYHFWKSPEKVAGTPIGDDERYFLENIELSKLPFVVNYKSLLPNMTKLRSSTYFFKDDNTGEIEYMLTVSINVDQMLHVRTLIDHFINGNTLEKSKQQKEINHTPKLNFSLPTIIDNIIAEGEKRYSTTVARMTMKEKQSLIREMFARGVFLIKGAVVEVSVKLGNSEATVYRYLKELENKEKRQ
jgi:predicted transcriptional regulator YheO